MNGRQVGRLENELERCIADALARLAEDDRDLEDPGGRAVHLMAKAAATVFEAISDARDSK